jgi:hypothetical protein
VDKTARIWDVQSGFAVSEELKHQQKVNVPPLRTEQPSTRPAESLSGLIERVTFHNEENWLTVLKAKAKGRRDVVKALAKAVRNNKAEQRYSGLLARLKIPAQPLAA